jgi:hypothetical protein
VLLRDNPAAQQLIHIDGRLRRTLPSRCLDAKCKKEKADQPHGY